MLAVGRRAIFLSYASLYVQATVTLCNETKLLFIRTSAGVNLLKIFIGILFQISASVKINFCLRVGLLNLIF
jgi:hypothetical protein